MRITTLTTSDAPSTASAAIDRMNDFDSANTMVARPKQATHANMMPADPPRERPVRQQRRDRQRADRGRRAQQAEPLRAGVEHFVGEDRQQRGGAAEQDREQIERDDAEHDRIVPDVGDAGEECREA